VPFLLRPLTMAQVSTSMNVAFRNGNDDFLHFQMHLFDTSLLTTTLWEQVRS